MVSVIVPTRNSARTLDGCLQSVRSQTVPTELIVVDNNSSDQTVEIAKRWADMVLQQGPERSAQRNAGLRAASSRAVAFIDSDMELEPEVLEEAVERLVDGAGGVTVPEYTEGHGFWADVRRFERSFYVGDDDVEAARIFDRELVRSLGGFDEDMPPGPEDWDLTIRVREVASVARTRSRIRHNEGAVTYVDACRKKAYYALGLRSFVRKHGRRRLVSSLDRVYLHRPWTLLYPSPALGAGVACLKAGEAVAVVAALVGDRSRGGRP